MCSPEYLEDELTFIRNTLKSNGYKTWQINKVICKKRNFILTPTSSTLNSHHNSDIKYISAPYINGVSEKINRQLKNHNLILSSKPTTTLKSKLCNLKDKVKQIDQNNVIYRLDCNDCDEIYIGESNRNLSKRMYEHENNVRNHNQNSLVFQHVANSGNHKINWDNPKVIDKNDHWKKRKFIESCYTISNSNAYNRAVDISPILTPIIKEICSKIKY